MPTTLPSPLDGGEFGFLAVDAAGRGWRRNDEELVWTCVAAGTDEDPPPGGDPAVVH